MRERFLPLFLLITVLFGSDAICEVTQLSNPHIAPANSILVGDNDPRYVVTDEAFSGSKFDLDAALTAIGASDTILQINSAVIVASNRRIPKNVKIKITERGSFAISAGTTLKIENGAEFEAPLKQVFSGEGSIKWEISVPPKIYPEWFGVFRGSRVAPAIQKANTKAINKAIDSLHTTNSTYTANRTGVVYFSDKQEYRFDGTIDLAGRRWITLTSGTPSGAKLRFTGTGTGTFITIASATHITISNLDIAYVNSEFAGYVIKSGRSGLSRSNGFLTGGTSYIYIHDNQIAGLQIGEDTGNPCLDAVLLQYDYGQIGYFERNQFFYGKHAILGKDGSPFSEVVMIRDNTFKRNADYAIKNAGSAWNIESNTFEPSYSAAAPTKWSTIKAYTQNDYWAYNVNFSGNWMGDVNNTEPGLPAFEGRFLGLKVSNNLFELNEGSKSLRLWATQGASITGNRGNSNAQIEFSSGTNRGVVIVGNSINVGRPYVVTGSATLINYMSSGNALGANFLGPALIVRGGVTGVGSTPFVAFQDLTGTEAGSVGPRSRFNNDVILLGAKGNGVRLRTNGSSADRLKIDKVGASVFSGSVAIGSGTPILNAISATAALDFGMTLAQKSADLNITLAGARVGDSVSLGVPNGSVNSDSNFTAWVSASNTVTVRFNNYSTRAVNPASGTFRVSVIRF